MSTPAPGGLRSRAKGKRGERELVRLARQYGLEARRTWQTAHADDPGDRACDVLIAGHRVQVKLARCGFDGVYQALDGVELAFLRQDRRPWVAVIPAKVLLAMFQDRGASVITPRHPFSQPFSEKRTPHA